MSKLRLIRLWKLRMQRQVISCSGRFEHDPVQQFSVAGRGPVSRTAVCTENVPFLTAAGGPASLPAAGSYYSHTGNTFK